VELQIRRITVRIRENLVRKDYIKMGIAGAVILTHIAACFGVLVYLSDYLEVKREERLRS
jgi:hypothetical protein